MRRRHKKTALVVGVVVVGLAASVVAHWIMDWSASRPLSFPEPAPDLTVRIVGGNLNFTESNLPRE